MSESIQVLGPSQFRIVLKGPLLLHFARSRGWPGPALDGASWQGLVGDSFALRMFAYLTCKTREGDIQILTVGNVRAAVESEWQLLCVSCWCGRKYHRFRRMDSSPCVHVCVLFFRLIGLGSRETQCDFALELKDRRTPGEDIINIIVHGFPHSC